MATKYTIAETAHTEESETFSSKGKAIEAADAAAEEYPGTTFVVSTAKGTIVHKAFAESVDVVDETPADEVPEVQVDDEEPVDFDATLAAVMDEDTDPDTGEDNTPGDDGEVAGQDDGAGDSDADIETDPSLNGALARIALDAVADSTPDADTDPGHGLEVVSAEEVVKALAQGAPAPAEPAAPVAPASAPAGATLELCAANTNAKRMHYRTIGEERSFCGSSKTTRRANEHQIETASMCPACEKLAGDEVVDTRPAGAARGGSGSRKAPKTVVMDAGEIRDLVAHLKKGDVFEMETTDGLRIQFVAGDPVTGDVDEDGTGVSDMQSLALVAS